MGRGKEDAVSLLKVRADAVPVVAVLSLFCAQLWACTLPPALASVAALVLLFFSGSLGVCGPRAACAFFFLLLFVCFRNTPQSLILSCDRPYA